MIDKKYKIIEDLGSGAFAQVKLVEDLESGEVSACKIFKGEYTEKTLATFKKESCITQNLKHENILPIKLAGCGPVSGGGIETAEPNVFYMLMDVAKHGEMFDIVANTGNFSEPVARHYFGQLLSGLKYLHEEAGIAHLDLKPQNLLLDEQLKLRIADFGHATCIKEKKVLKRVAGTISYMTPEQLQMKKYDGKKADMFAAGIILFMFVTRCQPFDKADPTDPCFNLIATKQSSFFWKVYEQVANLSDELKDLLVGMM